MVVRTIINLLDMAHSPLWPRLRTARHFKSSRSHQRDPSHSPDNRAVRQEYSQQLEMNLLYAAASDLFLLLLGAEGYA
jgi:hypothetical protein